MAFHVDASESESPVDSSSEPSSAAPSSDTLQQHVAVGMLHAVVPEEHPMLHWDLLGPVHDHLGDRLEVLQNHMELERLHHLVDGLTFFPTGRRPGLMSRRLNAAKKSSMGLAE